MEHRWGRRIDAVIPIRLRPLVNLREHDAHLANLSVSGGFTPMRLNVRKFSRIQVVFDLPELLGRAPQEVNAYVARQSAAGTGLEWCEHAPLAIVKLLRFFNQSTPVEDDASPIGCATLYLGQPAGSLVPPEPA